MKVKKEVKEELNISEVDNNHIIIVKFRDVWYIMQSETYEANTYVLLALSESSLTRKNIIDLGKNINYWFNECEEMHAFKTTKEAFKFLIKKL